MAKKIFFTAVLLILSVVSVVPSSYGREKAMKHEKAVGVRLALRDLWTDHVFWVRSVVLATSKGDADAAKAYEDKVVENAKSIAGSIEPFYGKDASDNLFKLLAGHYGAIRDYMNASLEGNKDAKSSALEAMNRNAGEIANFLNGANPKNWPKDSVNALLMGHIGHHAAQIDDVAAKDFAAEANEWAAMKKNAYDIADALAAGLVKQFPKKFK